MKSAFVQNPRPIRNGSSIFEMLPYIWMSFPPLELLIRAKKSVLVVKAHHKTNKHLDMSSK
jgi:hypothetical protein